MPDCGGLSPTMLWGSPLWTNALQHAFHFGTPIHQLKLEIRDPSERNLHDSWGLEMACKVFLEVAIRFGHFLRGMTKKRLNFLLTCNRACSETHTHMHVHVHVPSLFHVSKTSSN